MSIPSTPSNPSTPVADLSTYFHDRLQLVAGNGDERCFPNYFKPDTTVPDFQRAWKYLVAGDKSVTSITMAGRVENKRIASKNLIFLDVEGDSTSSSSSSFDTMTDNHFQVVLNMKEYHDMPYTIPFKDVKSHINRGDVIGVIGQPHRTLRGELSVLCHSVQILAPCLHDIPRELEDRKLIDRKRYLHFIVNKEAKNPIIMRSRFIKKIRHFLDDRGFLELETPMLEHGTGANAAPFITRYNAMECDVNLRVAPELYLKRAVIAGFGKVYEIGRQFRNEGMDGRHNPEFTTCEFYHPYATVYDLIGMTEQMLHQLSLTAGKFLKDGINWEPPYTKINIIPTLLLKLEALGITDGLEPYTVDHLLMINRRAGLTLPTVLTQSKLMDNLISELLEPDCVNPTFLYGHPMFMCPLAKPEPENPRIAQRFELFAKGMELCNAYSELNNSVLQRATLLDQEQNRAIGDTETIHDESYCEAMEYGLPPTAGWGMGIDRLLMLMLGIDRIGDTMAFQVTRAASCVSK
jgi:lysyl-tRNA synthetase class 2